MDADLAVPGLQIFKFESKCVVRASLFGVHVFIVSVIFFTRKIRNLLQSRGGSIAYFESIFRRFYIGSWYDPCILFPFEGKADPVFCQLVGLVFDFDLLRIFGHTKTEIADGIASCRQGGREIFLAAVIGLSSKAVRKTAEGKQRDGAVTFHADIPESKLQIDVFISGCRLLIFTFLHIVSACHISDLQISVLKTIAYTVNILHGTLIGAFFFIFIAFFKSRTCQITSPI